MQVLDEMVVRITGDQTRYKKAMDDAVTTTKKGIADITAETKKFRDVVDDMGKDGEGEEGGKFGMKAKQIKGLGRAAGAASMLFGQLADESSTLGKSLTGLGTAALLYQVNPILGVGMALKTVVELFKEQKKEMTEIEKLYQEILKGAQQQATAISGFRVSSLLDELRSAEPWIRRLEGRPGGLGGASTEPGGPAGETRAQMLARRIRERAEGHVDELQRLLESPVGRMVQGSIQTEQVNERIDAFQREREIRRGTLGMTEREAALFTDLERIRRGAGRDYLGTIEQQQTRMQLLNDEIDEQIIKLQREAEVVGLSADAAMRFRLEQRGATEAQIEQIRVLQSAREVWQQFLDAQGRAHQQSQALYERTRTPTERIQEETASINRLFARGTLDVDTYTRAILEQQQALQQLQSTQEQFDAVRFGSAAARSRLEAQRALFAAASLPPDVQQRIAQREAQNAPASGATLVVRDTEDKPADAQTELLKAMLSALQQIAGFPQVELTGAGF